MDYSTKYASKLAEHFRRASLTDGAAGREFDFTGARSVKIYSMVAADLVDYERGGSRYGDVTDLEYASQELLCSQAKAFTKHLDALDGSDAAIDNAAGRFLRMELDEVVTPVMDKYRLKKWVMGAGTLRQSADAPTKATIVADIMSLKGAMGDNLVPDTNLTLFIPNQYFILLKQADAVVGLEGMGGKAVEKGVVGTFDGMKVVPVPSSWLPAGIHFLIKAKGTSADPVKLAQYDVIRQSVGYSGPVVQGLVYYDSFVVGAKCAGIGVAGTSAAVLNAPVLAIANHKVTVTAVTGVTFRCTVDGSDPRSSATAVDFPAGGVTLTAGQTIKVVGVKDGCAGLVSEKAYE